MAEWWDKMPKIPLTDSNFQKIIGFYLFNCPCETEKGSKNKGRKTYTKVSKRAKTLRSQGWTGGYLNTLLASMKHTASGNLEYQVFSPAIDICASVQRIEENSSMKDSHFEMVAFSERRDMNKTSSIFYYIRNAFAHGSFSVITAAGKKIYYLESAKGDTVKAQIRLREETMLKWIKDFSASPQALKKALDSDRKKRKNSRRGTRAA